MNDETLYVAPSSKLTDYSQPPMTNFYYGVLNTGRRRYAHPALSGSLPSPWLPAPDRPKAFGDGAAERRGVVLSLRRKMGRFGRKGRKSLGENGFGSGSASGAGSGLLSIPDGWASGSGSGSGSGGGSREGTIRNKREPSNSSLIDSSNPWREGSNTSFGIDNSHNDYETRSQSRDKSGSGKRRSYEPVSGGIELPLDNEGNVWDDVESEDEVENGGMESPVSVLLSFLLVIVPRWSAISP